MTYEALVLLIYVIYLIIMSLICFALFVVDKRLAILDEKRIKEKALLFYVVYGGALGGLLGRIIVRHKTKKSYFSIVIYLALVLQMLCLIILILNKITIRDMKMKPKPMQGFYNKIILILNKITIRVDIVYIIFF